MQLSSVFDTRLDLQLSKDLLCTIEEWAIINCNRQFSQFETYCIPWEIFPNLLLYICNLIMWPRHIILQNLNTVLNMIIQWNRPKAISENCIFIFHRYNTHLFELFLKKIWAIYDQYLKNILWPLKYNIISQVLRCRTLHLTRLWFLRKLIY